MRFNLVTSGVSVCRVSASVSASVPSSFCLGFSASASSSSSSSSPSSSSSSGGGGGGGGGSGTGPSAAYANTLVSPLTSIKEFYAGFRKELHASLIANEMTNAASVVSVQPGSAQTLEDTVLINRVSSRLGVLTLHNPERLNALTPKMIREMRMHVDAVEGAAAMYIDKDKKEDEDVAVSNHSFNCLLVRGAPRASKAGTLPKPAFCAGGDVRGILKLKPQEAMQFFTEEYSLDHRTSTVTVPYVSIWDGPVMGGGVGVSAHGSYRVATERCVFAMPECAIGIFPDVGGTHLLSSLPRALGNYLALTGGKLSGLEAYEAGIATHFVRSSQIGSLVDRLAQSADIAVSRNVARAGIEQVLAEVTVAAMDTDDVKRTELSLLRDGGYLNRCFDAETVEECVAKLKEERLRIDEQLAAAKNEQLERVREWIVSCEAAMETANPLSLKVSMALLRYGRGSGDGKRPSLAECLRAEARAMWHFVKTLDDADDAKKGDFFAGVTHRLVTKSPGSPPWQYSRLEDVSDRDVDMVMNATSDDDNVLTPLAKL